MKITNGTDIVEISRIKKNIENYGEKFLKRIFTDKEIEYCESKRNQKYQSYAVRFAAKEAAYKALSNYIDCEYSWTDFEIQKDLNGKPKLKLYLNLKNIQDIEISLSHCKEYAIANVVVIYEEN